MLYLMISILSFLRSLISFILQSEAVVVAVSDISDCYVISGQDVRELQLVCPQSHVMEIL